MKNKQKILARIPLVVLCLGLWTAAFRPVPVNFDKAIPFTSHHVGSKVVSQLVPGDHLQLLYHFWLTREKLAGRTPALHNVYEFNTGDDEARREPDPGYLPFSLVYAILSPTLGHAAGWNAAQLAALLTAFFLLHQLARRYRNGFPSQPASARNTRFSIANTAATLVAFSLPYQWITLAAGSPTGFGMAMLPAIALGLDIAVRDRRRRGGWLAGAAIMGCYASDLHSFFFGTLMVPIWCILAWTTTDRPLLPKRSDLRQLIRSLWPAAAAGAAAVLIARYLSALYATTDVAAGRSLSDVLNNSPAPRALLGIVRSGTDAHAQIGATILLAVAIATTFALWRTCSTPRAEDQPRWRAYLPIALLLIGVAAILLLAMGLRAPANGLPIRSIRKILPPYRMIRQPLKVLCLLPTVVTPLLAAGFGALRMREPQADAQTAPASQPARIHAFFFRILPPLAALAAASSLATTLRMGLTPLPPQNIAYQSVLQNAADRGARPHVLALPIWPGDSAWSSLYEYQAMLGRIRFVNGYSPACSLDYVENAYRRFESITQGRMTAGQAQALHQMGVTAIVLHEGSPDVVSPFPPMATHDRLIANEWLEPLPSGDGCRAFALRQSPDTATGQPSPANAAAPPPAVARRWQWPVDAAPNSIIAALRSPVADWPNLRWLVRTHGDGKLNLHRSYAEPDLDASVYEQTDEADLDAKMYFAKRTAGAHNAPAHLLHQTLDAASGEMVRWIALALDNLPNNGWGTPVLKIDCTAGQVRISDVLLVAGPDTLSTTNLTLSARMMFHSGDTIGDDGADDGVTFAPQRHGAGAVMRGPFLPLSPGRWQLTLTGDFHAQNMDRVRIFLGNREVAGGGISTAHETGETAPIEFTSDYMEPLNIVYEYGGHWGTRLRELRLTKSSTNSD